MDNKLTQLYSQIANYLDSMIPTEWDKIYLLGEIETRPVSISSTFYFVESTTNQIVRGYHIPEKYNISEKTFDIFNHKLNTAIFELNNCFKNNGQKLWDQVVFTLDNSGKFNIDFHYDGMNENNGDTLTREIIWAYNTFGYIPKEGTYLKELLDKYLNK